MTARLCLLALATFALIGEVTAQTTFTYNFNSGQSDFLNTFTTNPNAGTINYSATGGIGGSGSFATSGDSAATTIFNTGLSNYNGATITTSFYFQTRSTLSTQDLVGFGLFTSTTSRFDAATGAQGYKINGTNSSSLTASTWYQLTAVTTNNGTAFHTTLSLQSYGANGQTLTGSPISIGASDNAGGAGLLSAGTIYVGLYGGADFGPSSFNQTPAIDNFSVTGVSAIPEPSTYAALAGAGVLALAWWRRRQSA